MYKKMAWLSGIFVLAVIGVVTAAQAVSVEPGSNKVSVYSCVQVGNDIKIRRSSSESEYILTSTCRNAGHGNRQYTMKCNSTKEYQVSWTECPLVNVPPIVLNPVFDSFGVSSLGDHSGTGYWEGHKSYLTPAKVVIPASWSNYNVQVFTKSGLQNANSYTYGFAWVEHNGDSAPVVNEAVAKQLAKIASFNYSMNRSFAVSDSGRNKTRTFVAFARNNDGVSRVPNMPVEVDDIIALRVYLEPMADTQSPSLSFTVSALKNTISSNNTYSYRVNVTASDSSSNIKGINVVTKQANGTVVDSFWVDNKNGLSASESGFGSKSVTRSITRPGLKLGEEYTVVVASYDVSGNVRTSSPLKVYLASQDSVAPTIDANVSFASTWDVGYKTKRFVPTLVATANDNVKVTKIVLYHNTSYLWEGYTAVKTCENSSGVKTCSHALGALTRGNFYAQAWDAAGNSVESVRFAF